MPYDDEKDKRFTWLFTIGFVLYSGAVFILGETIGWNGALDYHNQGHDIQRRNQK